MTEAGRITAIIDGDISALTSKLAQAKSQATASVSGIESEMRGKIGTGISEALSGGDYSKAGRQIGGSLVDGITAGFGPLGSAVGEVATALGPAGIVATSAVAGAVVIGSAAISAANEWEAGMSKISKTTGIEKGSTGFNELNDDLKDLYATMPTTVSEIQNVASAAGSLGIAKSEIAGFTQGALQMGSAFDVPAEHAAVSVGKIKSQLKSYTAEVMDASGAVSDSKFAQHFGSAVDFVGNSLNATEAEVLDFSTRTAGPFSTLNGNMYELAGWGGELASVFPSSELAAGSFNAALNQLMGTTKGSENARAKAGELLGVTPEEFQELMTNDPTDTILNLGKAMEGLSDTERFQAAGILGGGYGDDFFLKMIGKTDEWREDIDATVEAGKKGESIGTSYGAGVDQALAQIQVLKNSVGAILTDIGGPIGSAMAPVISAVAGSFNSLRKVGENLWGPFTTAISPATTAVSLLASGVGTLAGMQLDGLVYASEAVNTGFEVGSAFVSAFGEEIGKVITSSSTFQTIAGYVDNLKTSISGITLDGLISGFTNLTGIDLSGFVDNIKSQISGITKEDVVSGISGATGISEDTVGGVADFLGNVYDNAAEKLGWGVKEGTKKGIKEGSDAAKGQVESDLTDAAKSAAEAFAKENDAYIKAHPGGMSLVGGKIVGGADHTSTYLKPGTTSDFATMLASYNALHFSGESVESSGFWNIFDESGKVVAEKVLDLEAWKDKMQPVVLELEDYFDTARTSISGSLESAIQDGVIDPLNEKPLLEGLIKQLDELEQIAPIEFEAAGLDKLRKKVEDAVNGVLVTFRTEKLETNFALWLSKNADEYQRIYEKTKSVPLESGEKQLWQTLQLASDRGRELFSYIDQAATSGNYQDIEVLPEVINELAKVDPELLNLEATHQRLRTAEEAYADQVKIVNGRFVVLDENGKTLSAAHIRTSQAADILSGGLTSAASSAAAFAAKVGSLDSLFGNYALSLRSNATQSAQYDYPGSGGRTSWNNVFGNYTSQFSLPKFAEGAHVTGPTVALVGESGPETVIPDKYLQSGGYSTGFYPSTQKTPAANYWNALYDNSGTCVAFAEPDPSLKFTPPGSVTSDYVAVFDANGNPVAYAEKSNQVFSGISGGSTSKTVSIDASPAGALVTGLSKNGYVVTYDPRTDTCAGLPFNAPDPSLKTTDPFYLGLTQNSPAYKSVDEDGWGGVVAQALTPELAAMQEQYQQQLKESEKTTSNTQQTATNTANMVSGLGSFGSAISGALVSSGGNSYSSGGSAIIGLANRGGGTVWGGTSISGGGSWIGTGATSNGWGAQASNALRTTGSYSTGSFSAKGGSGSYQLPAIFRDKGGLIDRGPELAIVGEAGTEMILPPHVTQAVLGMTAKGGGAAPNITIHYAPVIQGTGLSAEELAVVLEKDRAALIDQITEASRGF